MENFRQNLQNHKSIVWMVILGYLVFNGGIIFPFYNELSKLDYEKIVMAIGCYAIIGMCFTGVLSKGKGIMVLAVSFLFTAIGMVGRYFMEYGKVSNTVNFTPANIIMFLIVVPVYCMVVYLVLYKSCDK